jgi:hypothetical protein
MNPTWTDIITALASALVPVLVVVIGVVLARRQSRNQELIKVRLEYYRSLVPLLNRLMCYMTFIGTWRDESPKEIVALKRHLDTIFFTAAPLFGPEIASAYRVVMDLSFTTFGEWGRDAQIKTSGYRRRQAWQREDPWISSWDKIFVLADDETISKEFLSGYRRSYDDLIAALVTDINISRSRIGYTTTRVSLNAQAPSRQDINGSLRRSDVD